MGKGKDGTALGQLTKNKQMNYSFVWVLEDPIFVPLDKVASRCWHSHALQVIRGSKVYMDYLSV